MPVTHKVEGFRELEKALADLGKRTGKGALRRAGMRALEPMRAAAAARAPVLSGTLRAAIAVSTRLVPSQRRKSARGRKAKVTIHMGPPNLPQAVLQEFGTRNHVAQPFMRPAFDRFKHATVHGLLVTLREEIEKAAARAAKRAKLRK